MRSIISIVMVFLIFFCSCREEEVEEFYIDTSRFEGIEYIPCMIEFTKMNWVKAEVKGIENMKCPECGMVMVFNYPFETAIAFCIGCGSYYMACEEDENEKGEKKVQD